MSSEKVTVAEKYPKSRVQIIYQIDTITRSAGLCWEPLGTREVKHEGKFISYHKDFKGLAFSKTRVLTEERTFAFSDEETAMALAKLLSKIWDMPLRVTKVQNIRVQSQCGKIVMPNGGM